MRSKDLLSTEVLGGKPIRRRGLAMVGPVTPPNLVGVPARRGVVYLRESHSISKALYSRTCIGTTTDLPAGWSVAGRFTVDVLARVQRPFVIAATG